MPNLSFDIGIMAKINLDTISQFYFKVLEKLHKQSYLIFILDPLYSFINFLLTTDGCIVFTTPLSIFQDMPEFLLDLYEIDFKWTFIG